MESKILGVFDCGVWPKGELTSILEFSCEDKNYNEFRIGDWKTFVIRNSSGADNDGLVSSDAGEAIITPRGQVLPVLNEWIDTVFDTSRLRLARIHSLGDGVLIPHKDFIELGGNTPAWGRVHVPILTNEQCLHSEEEVVFRMRPGEIWLFEASCLHSAVNFSGKTRLNLCLDFELGDAPACSLLRNRFSGAVMPPPEIVQRPPMNDEFMNGLMGLSACINEHNVRDVIGLLAKVHFYRQVPLSLFFEWLFKIAEQSGNVALINKVAAFACFLRAQRSMSERFTL